VTQTALPTALPTALRDLLIEVRNGLRARGDDGVQGGHRARVPVKMGWTEVRAVYALHIALSKARAAKRDFDIVINCTGSSLFELGHRLPHELQEFVVAPKAEEILLDWEDGADINLTPEFWPALTEYLRTKKAKTLVHCLGGHGRTGTVAACLLVAACNYGANQAIKWVRKNYCEEAIETAAQVQYVRRVAKALKEKKDSRKRVPPKKE